MVLELVWPSCDSSVVLDLVELDENHEEACQAIIRKSN